MDESTTAFDAEAGLHTTESNPQHARSGECSVLAAVGGIDSSAAETHPTEQQPLLDRSIPAEPHTRKHDPNNTDDDPDSHGSTVWNGMDDFEGLPWYKRPHLYWVLIPFSLVAITFGGIIAPRVSLILNLVCREYYADPRHNTDPALSVLPVLFDGSTNEQCRIGPVQAQASQFNLYGNLIAGLLSAVTSPILGSLSDRYGRTRLIALTSLGSILSEMFFIVAANNPGTFNMNWILVGFALDGITGSFTTAFAIVHAYVSDCVPPSERSVAFAYFHGCLFTGLAVGPVLASLITKWTGTPITPFYVLLTVHVLFMLFCLLLLPESLSRRRQNRARAVRKREQLRATSTSDWIDHLRSINLFEPLKILWPTGSPGAVAIRRNLSILAAIDTLTFGIAMGSMSIVLLYANYRFAWQTYESGIYMSIVNTCRVSILVVFLPLLTRFVRGPRQKDQPSTSASISTTSDTTIVNGAPIAHSTKLYKAGADSFDLTVIRTAIFFDAIGYAGYALSSNGAQMTISGVITSIGGVTSPTLQAAMTKHVPQDRVGQLLGASGLLHALARVVAPTVCNGVYSLTVSGAYPQSVFWGLTATFAVVFGLSFGLKTGVSVDDMHECGPASET